jgi:hypothetical protein
MGSRDPGPNRSRGHRDAADGVRGPHPSGVRHEAGSRVTVGARQAHRVPPITGGRPAWRDERRAIGQKGADTRPQGARSAERRVRARSTECRARIGGYGVGPPSRRNWPTSTRRTGDRLLVPRGTFGAFTELGDRRPGRSWSRRGQTPGLGASGRGWALAPHPQRPGRVCHPARVSSILRPNFR